MNDDGGGGRKLGKKMNGPLLREKDQEERNSVPFFLTGPLIINGQIVLFTDTYQVSLRQLANILY